MKLNSTFRDTIQSNSIQKIVTLASKIRTGWRLSKDFRVWGWCGGLLEKGGRVRLKASPPPPSPNPTPLLLCYFPFHKNVQPSILTSAFCCPTPPYPAHHGTIHLTPSLCTQQDMLVAHLRRIFCKCVWRKVLFRAIPRMEG